MIFSHLHLLQIKNRCISSTSIHYPLSRPPLMKGWWLRHGGRWEQKNMLNIEITSKAAVFTASNVIVGRRWQWLKEIQETAELWHRLRACMGRVSGNEVAPDWDCFTPRWGNIKSSKKFCDIVSFKLLSISFWHRLWGLRRTFWAPRSLCSPAVRDDEDNLTPTPHHVMPQATVVQFFDFRERKKRRKTNRWLMNMW